MEKNILKGSIVNINQTVNGQSIFVVLDIENLDVRYAYDLTKKYEYDVSELLDLNTTEKTIDVIGNIYDFLATFDHD